MRRRIRGNLGRRPHRPFRGDAKATTIVVAEEVAEVTKITLAQAEAAEKVKTEVYLGLMKKHFEPPDL